MLKTWSADGVTGCDADAASTATWSMRPAVRNDGRRSGRVNPMLGVCVNVGCHCWDPQRHCGYAHIMISSRPRWIGSYQRVVRQSAWLSDGVGLSWEGASSGPRARDASSQLRRGRRQISGSIVGTPASPDCPRHRHPALAVKALVRAPALNLRSPRRVQRYRRDYSACQDVLGGRSQ